MKNYLKKPSKGGFTLAEMMVVLLILSIIMAAMAPVMTTRMAASKSAENTSPWKYVRDSGKSQAYFGFDDNHKAMIGQREIPADSTENARLIINAPEAVYGTSPMSHILFKRGDTIFGTLSLSSNPSEGANNRSILLGDLSNTSKLPGSRTTVIGNDVTLINNAEDDNDYTSQATVLGANAVASGGSISIGVAASAPNNSIAIGNDAMGANTATASNNIAIGHNALNGVPSNYNIAIGNSVLSKTVSGANIGVGYNVLSNNDKGYDNTAVGAFAMVANTEGANNTAVGYSAMNANTTGKNNIAFGSNALKANTTGYNNVSVGYEALTANIGGLSNTAIGYYALKNNTSGSVNTAVGLEALKANTTGGGNTAVGNALDRNTTGTENTAIGNGALSGNTTGKNNTAVGRGALIGNKTGDYNIAVGYDVMFSNSTGSNNIAIGHAALYNNTTGSNNIGVGEYACQYVKGSNKICIGANSGPDEKSDWAKESNTDEIIYLGSNPKTIHDVFKDWGHNSAVVQIENISGDGKTLGQDKPGRRKGYTDGPTVFINGNLIVRGYLGALIADDRGDEYDEWGILSSNKPNGDDHMVKWGKVDWPSDRRLKYVGKESTSGLDKIRQLKIFNYTFKKDEKKTPHVGVIAQDLQKIFPDAVTKGDDGFLRIRMEDMFYAVINAIKELDAKVTEILKQVQNDRSEIKQLKKENQELKKRLEALEAKVK